MMWVGGWLQNWRMSIWRVRAQIILIMEVNRGGSGGVVEHFGSLICRKRKMIFALCRYSWERSLDASEASRCSILHETRLSCHGPVLPSGQWTRQADERGSANLTRGTVLSMTWTFSRHLSPPPGTLRWAISDRPCRLVTRPELFTEAYLTTFPHSPRPSPLSTTARTMSEPLVVPSSAALPTTANGPNGTNGNNGTNGTFTPVLIQRGNTGQGAAGGGGGSFGVKTGLAQMLKGG